MRRMRFVSGSRATYPRFSSTTDMRNALASGSTPASTISDSNTPPGWCDRRSSIAKHAWTLGISYLPTFFTCRLCFQMGKLFSVRKTVYHIPAVPVNREMQGTAHVDRGTPGLK